MTQVELFLYGCLIFVLPFIFGLLTGKKKVDKPKVQYRVVIEPVVVREKERPKQKPTSIKKEPQPPKEEDFTKTVAFNEAKSALVGMGYKAGSVKDLLKSIGQCNSAEEYIKQALTRRPS